MKYNISLPTIESIIMLICEKEKLSLGKDFFKSIKYVQNLIYPVVL